MNADNYRRYARACLELASIMADIHTRVTMIEVAGGWLRLAEQVEEKVAPAINELQRQAS